MSTLPAQWGRVQADRALEKFRQYLVIANRKKSAGKQKAGSQATNPKPAVSVNRGDGDTMAAQAEQVKHSKKPLRIVGVGCSAGGLEALDGFFSHAVPNSGLAYVVVQHLDPIHPSSLAGLLQRVTSMAVIEATEGVPVRANCVYVIPPNRDLAFEHGALHLIEPLLPRGKRLAVDYFFRTLADQCAEQAIAVVLSGMGSDGVMGLRAIKEKLGLTLAQDPATAKSDSMPRSVIEAGLVDIVAPPEQLPGRIVEFLRRATPSVLEEQALTVNSTSALEQIVTLLRDRSGADFSLYKTSTLYRRIERRTAVHHLSGIADYVRYLRENPKELDLLFKELLIGVTRFFRDTELWESLRTTVLPALIAKYPAGRVFRAWLPACSTGEEAYSLAIVFRETVEALNPKARFGLHIFATDLDPDAIDRARQGKFPKNIEADVSSARLQRYFVPDEDGYRVGKEVRDMAIFATQNVISDPPFTKLDIISCRNLFIYLRPELQKKILPLFHYALVSNGLLILSTAEAIGNFDDLFAPTDNKARIFHRLDQNMPNSTLIFPRTAGHDARELAAAVHAERPDSIEYLTDQFIQQNFAPPAVLVNAEGDILYISGRTGKYLEPAAGKVNINLYAMAREGLREALTGVIASALRRQKSIHLNGLQVGTNGGTQIVNVTVRAIESPQALSGRVIVIFEDVAAPLASKRRGKSVTASAQDALTQELIQVRESLRLTHEEMQSSLEELKSSNEELQSTNEELQSTNEELTTSKEEMQSADEEMQTVNAELQSKVDDLMWERNDMRNLLNSTEIATIFLDNDMNVRRYTPHATGLFNLIPGDVGRPLADIVSKMVYADLQADAINVLSTLTFCEKQVMTMEGDSLRVRIMPYRTHHNVIDGVVITFIDIAKLTLLERELQRQGL